MSATTNPGEYERQPETGTTPRYSIFPDFETGVVAVSNGTKVLIVTDSQNALLQMWGALLATDGHVDPEILARELFESEWKIQHPNG